MSRKITEDQEKIDLVSRLVKEGAIDFAEAVKLLEVETELQMLTQPNPYDPFNPYNPYGFPTIMYGSGCSITLELLGNGNAGTTFVN